MVDPTPVRLERYLRLHGISASGMLGEGKDGGVWVTSRRTALKVHERTESYHAERNAYIRFRDLDLDEMAGFKVPVMREYDDDLLAIEMTVVTPPFVVDFASVRLDVPDDLIEDEGHTLIDMIRERFDEDADQVIELVEELGSYAGVYLTDVHRHNIRLT